MASRGLSGPLGSGIAGNLIMGPACPEQESVSTVKAQTFTFSHGKLIAISIERARTLVAVESLGKELTRSSYTVFFECGKDVLRFLVFYVAQS